MLAEHRIHDADKGFIAVEQPMPTSEQITFQPTLALVFAQHRIQHASGGREKFVILYFTRIPLAVGDFKNLSLIHI